MEFLNPKMKELHLTTSDGYRIVAHLFSPEKSNGKFLLVNSATGVKQQIYFSFAKYFAENGYTVICYDYRGIGLSKPQKMKGFESSMRTWGTTDFKALTDYIQEYYAGYQKFCLGHSVGALILGMNKDSAIFEKFVFVGTQKAFVGNLNFKTKVLSYVGFGIVQPISTKLLGYFPAQYMGLGESLPAGSANDWRTLVLNKKSTNRLLEKIDEDYSKNLAQDVLVIRAEDDSWLTDKAVRTLLEETYPNMKPVYRLVHTVESAKGEIGHINFFRSYNIKLWEIVLDYLKD